MRVLIAGCGYVGSALAARLVERGHEVFGLKRGAAELPPGVTVVQGDLTRRETLALPAVDAVVFAAAPAESTDQAYRAVYVGGLDNLLSRCSASARLVFCSSTSVYAQTGGAWVDEGADTSPEGFAGRRLLEAEALLAGRPLATVVRFAGIYGPGRTRLIDEVREGRAVIHEGPPQWTNRIHRDDCAAVLSHLLSLAAPERLYNGADGAPAQRAEVLRFLAKRLGVPPPPLVPGPGPAGPRGDSSKRVSSFRLVSSGLRFIYPSYREGYAALLR